MKARTARLTTIAAMFALAILVSLTTGCASSLPTSIPEGSAQDATVADLADECRRTGRVYVSETTGTRIRNRVRDERATLGGCS